MKTKVSKAQNDWFVFRETQVYQSFSEFLRTSTFGKELAYLLYKSLLPFLTFLTCKGPYWETFPQHLSIFRYCACAIRRFSKSKKQIYWSNNWCRALLNYNSCKKRIKEAVAPNMTSCNNMPWLMKKYQ